MVGRGRGGGTILATVDAAGDQRHRGSILDGGSDAVSARLSGV